MADDKPSLESFVFDFVSSSYRPYAPLRSMQSAGFRATSYNGMMHDGQFKKRGAIISSGTISVDQNGQYTEKYNGQTPGELQLYYIDPISATVEGPYFIFLTTTECVVVSLSPGTVTNVTPRYTTGTVSITTGTTALTGTATTWSASGITAGQLWIAPDASVHVINSVNSDTSITLKANYTGTTLTNSAYTIRRTGRLSTAAQSGAPQNLFARVFNGDLYYTYIEGASNACVVKVANINGIRSGGLGTPTIIGAFQYNNGSGCDLWGTTTSSINEIKGMELLSDGRVVLATTETDTGGSRVSNRIRYSSHLNQLVWNNPPGGTNDVVDLPGEMNAMREFGAYLACHYDSGIVLATRTGQDDPPLSYQRVQTTRVGCFNPKAIANTPSGQVFLGADRSVYVFDGSGNTLITDATRTTFTGTTNHSAWHACYESSRQVVWFFDMYGSSDGTGMYAVDMTTGQTTYHKTGTIISAACDAQSPNTSIRLFCGLPSYDPAASGTGGATSTMWYSLSLTSVADSVPAFTGLTAPVAMSLVTDWIDFGMMGIDKTISHILVFYESTGAYTFRITAKRDGDLTGQTISFVTANTSTEEKFAKVFFQPKTSEKWQFVFDTATTCSSSWDVRPQRMLVYYRPVANVEPVPR